MKTVSSCSHTIYQWNYLVASEPLQFDCEFEQKAAAAVSSCGGVINSIQSEVGGMGVKFNGAILAKCIGAALLSNTNETALNYRRDGDYLSHSFLIIGRPSDQTIYLSLRGKIDETGASAKAKTTLRICMQRDDPERVRCTIITKLVVPFDPIDTSSEEQEGDIPCLIRRISLAQQFSAEGVGVPLYETVYAKTSAKNGKIYLYQERAKCDLYQRIEALDASDYSLNLPLAVGVAEELAGLHNRGIAHKDVKTENFLVMRDESVRIIDFETSRKKEDPAFFDCELGTLLYASPEQLEQHIDGICLERRDPFASDAFSLGLILYNLCHPSDHIWCNIAEEYNDKVASLAKDKDSDFEIRMARFQFALVRNNIAKTLSKLAAEAERDPSNKHLCVINRLLDPNPRTRMKVQEAALRLRELLDVPDTLQGTIRTRKNSV